jgi:hypothetical protein
VVANTHVVSSVPNGITVEVDRTGNPFTEDLLVEKLRIRDGHLQLSSARGLGIELNHEVVEPFRVTNPLNLPDGSYSDMMFGRDYLPPSLPYEETTG